MTSSLETLPRELLWQVVGYLSYSHATQLLQCSKRLRYNAEPAVYNSKDARNKAMQFACRTDRPNIIRLAVSYGASVNLTSSPLEINSPAPQESNWIQPLTLLRAMAHGSIDTFKTLLELGARLDGLDSEGYTVTEGVLLDFVRILVSLVASPGIAGNPDGEEFFRASLEAGLDQQIEKLDKDGKIYSPLAGLIENGASFDLIRTVLDRGADPNRPWASKYGLPVNPLSAAIERDSFPVFQLLIERGADVNGVEADSPRETPRHLPLFEAMRVLARFGTSRGAAWVQACLDNGADINQSTQLTHWAHGYPVHTSTPLRYFLESIDLEGLRPWVQGTHHPASGLKYLLSVGASADGLGRQTVRADTFIPPLREPLSCLEVALDIGSNYGLPGQFGIEASYLAAVELLVEHGAARNETAYILARHTPLSALHVPHSDSNGKCIQAVLATMLINDIPRHNASLVLWQYVWSLGVMYFDWPAVVTEMTARIIRDIMARGADLNGMHMLRGEDGRDEDENTEPMPVLHALCQRHATRLATQGAISPYDMQLSRNQDLFRLLIREGANPNIVVNDRTAFDILVDCTEGKELADYLLAHVLDLCAILQGQ
ncbi:hypothetical protein CONLIGDRAFT_150755 [Coniochaeta ligniaria NRRL 30616]|uniref:Ankyrin n=1 Tax=Coniochaeta ligniaria NRRL 30616 TaxID=1408157 RepID=A0A1J7J5P8_9PEZI|nr:hypothetical protein CONLIGDRAFT_150755 [Coniochaeta ligniaria NRRL 30616]